MFYTIYKITNKINNKIYIGKHQTKDLNDGYMGSGKLIQAAIQKHGLDNFEKEILFIFETETEMNTKEAELVTEEFVKEDTNYNLCPGGHGGWGYLNQNGLNNSGKDWEKIGKKISEQRTGIPRPDISEKLRIAYSEGRRKPTGACSPEMINEMRKRALSKEANLKRSETMKTKTGDKSSQFGTCWITNGQQNRKIKKQEAIPDGWYKGRKMK